MRRPRTTDSTHGLPLFPNLVRELIPTAVKYRDHDEATGHVLGGPFYYIEKGMGPKWKWLACLFAFFGVLVGLFGIGTFTQVNSICGAIRQFFDPDMVHKVTILGNDYSWVQGAACGTGVRRDAPSAGPLRTESGR